MLHFENLLVYNNKILTPPWWQIDWQVFARHSAASINFQRIPKVTVLWSFGKLDLKHSDETSLLSSASNVRMGWAASFKDHLRRIWAFSLWTVTVAFVHPSFLKCPPWGRSLPPTAEIGCVPVFQSNGIYWVHRCCGKKALHFTSVSCASSRKLTLKQMWTYCIQVWNNRPTHIVFAMPRPRMSSPESCFTTAAA